MIPTSPPARSRKDIDLPEIVSFSTDRNNRAVAGAVHLSSKTSPSQKFVIGNTTTSTSVVTSPLLNNNHKHNATSAENDHIVSSSFSIAGTVTNKTDLMNQQQQSQSQNSPTKKIATTLGSIACTLQRQHERERRVADINDVRGAIPVPVSKAKKPKRSRIDQGKNENAVRDVDEDEDELSFEALKNKFDQSVSLEVRRLLVTSQQRRKRRMMMAQQNQHHQQNQHQQDQTFGKDEQQFMNEQLFSRNHHNNKSDQREDIERVLDEASKDFLEAISPSKNTKSDDDKNQPDIDDDEHEEDEYKQMIPEDEEEIEEEEEEYEDNEEYEHDEKRIITRRRSSQQQQPKEHPPTGGSSSTVTEHNTSSTNANTPKHINYSRPSSYTSSTRVITSADQKSRDAEVAAIVNNDNNTNNVETRQTKSKMTTASSAPSSSFIENDGNEKSQMMGASERFMNTFGEPRAEKMALFDNKAFKNPHVSRTTPIEELQGKKNKHNNSGSLMDLSILSSPGDNNNTNQSTTTKSPSRTSPFRASMKTNFGHDHDHTNKNNNSSLRRGSRSDYKEQEQQEESPRSRQRRRFETLRYKNELETSMASSSSFKSPSAAQYTYKRTFQADGPPPKSILEKPGTLTHVSLLNANARGGVASRDGTVPIQEAGKAVAELLHPTHKKRKGSGTYLQTEEGKRENDRMAETCILKRSLFDDAGRQVTIWPSVSVLGAGMRNDGKRLASTLKKFRSELAKTEKQFWAAHPSPPRRASMIEKQIAKQREQDNMMSQRHLANLGFGLERRPSTGTSVSSARNNNNNNNVSSTSPPTAKKWSRPSSTTSSTHIVAKEGGDFGYRPVVQ